MGENNLVNNNLINWIQKIIHLRISSNLILNFNFERSIWIINISDSAKYIKIPLIKSLYKIGCAEKLKTSIWESGNEGFFLKENFIQMPGKDQPEKIIKTEENYIQINYDILGLTYWMLSRCEEINPNKSILDKHNRFPSKASHAYKNNYLKRPIVDEWHLILRQIISKLWPQINLVKLNFKTVLSHDVDRPSSYLYLNNRKFFYNSASQFLRNRNLIELVRRTKNRFLKSSSVDQNDVYNTFSKIMETSESKNLKSTFNFMTGGNHRFDGNYKINNKGIVELIKEIIQRGHQVGIHPSYNSAINNKISAETNLLREVIIKNKIKYEINTSRMHYLRYDSKTTPILLYEAGIKCDSSMGYADSTGFRSGTCFKYPMFDPIRKEEIGIYQLPLIAMEGSVMNPAYMNLGHTKDAFKEFSYLKAQCKFVGGNFTLLWHNCSLTTKKDWELYINIIDS